MLLTVEYMSAFYIIDYIQVILNYFFNLKKLLLFLNPFITYSLISYSIDGYKIFDDSADSNI